MPSPEIIYWPQFVFKAIGCMAGPMLCQIGLQKYRRVRMIKNTPTSKAASVAAGIAELKGASKPFKDLVAPFSNQRCSYWRCDVAGADKKTKSQAIKTIDCGEPFYLSDSTGSVLIDPSGASIDVITNDFNPLQSKERMALLKSWGIVEEGTSLITLITIRETIIPESCGLYVFGEAVPLTNAPDGSGPTLVIRKPKGDYPFIISDKAEASVAQASESVSIANMLLGMIIMVVFLPDAVKNMEVWSTYAKIAFVAGSSGIGFMLPLMFKSLQSKGVKIP